MRESDLYDWDGDLVKSNPLIISPYGIGMVCVSGLASDLPLDCIVTKKKQYSCIGQNNKVNLFVGIEYLRPIALSDLPLYMDRKYKSKEFLELFR
jgi:hypothetical protein